MSDDDRNTPAPPSSPPTDIVPFSRWHALVARAKRLSDIDAILAHPSALSLVQAMPAQDLFFAIKQVGISDCIELLGLCHPRQVQTFLDLDGWNKDRIDIERVEPWLDALMASTPEIVTEALEGLDPEVWLLILQPHVRIHDWAVEVMDQFGDDDLVFQSPDNLYVVELLQPATKGGALAQRVLTHLFKVETPNVWRKLFEGLRLEIPAELEEEAYRYRKGRIADLGFVDHEEASIVYAYLDPQAMRQKGAPEGTVIEAAGEGASDLASTLPAPYARSLGDDSFVVRTLARITSEEVVEGLTRQLIALVNRVLIADDVDVGESDDVQAAVGRVRNHLSIALEFLSDGDPDAAVRFVLGHALRELHRAGFSLTLQLKHRADALFRSGWLARNDARLDLLDAAEQALLAGLRKKRPQLYAGLLEASRVDHRDFGSLHDVERAGEALDRLDLVGWLFLDVLKVDPLTTPPALSFTSLFRSAVVHQALGKGFKFDPVTGAELAAFVRSHMEAHGDVRVLGEDVRDETTLFVEGLVTERGAPARASARVLVAQWLGVLESELCALDPEQPIDARFVGGLWLATPR